jgi:hypothetical protein
MFLVNLPFKLLHQFGDYLTERTIADDWGLRRTTPTPTSLSNSYAIPELLSHSPTGSVTTPGGDREFASVSVS